MKKILSILILLSLFSFGFSTVEAQYRCKRYYYNDSDQSYRICKPVRHKRSWWQKHRNKTTVLLGTGTGAVIGGLTAGKRGAIVGSIIGGSGSAIYTYRIRKRHRYYRRY